MELAPIILFAYNRPDHTLKTLTALSRNDLSDESTLYIFCDGSKDDGDAIKVDEVRAIAKSNKWCKNVVVIEQPGNKGLAASIVEGVTEIIRKYGKVIVLEDDLITSKGFLRYMNNALDVYQNDHEVMHISAYMFPVGEVLPETFFYNQASCWGWGTWERAWSKLETDASLLVSRFQTKEEINKFNVDGAYDFYSHLKFNASKQWNTWAVKWHASVFFNGGLCLQPGRSLVRNIGFDDSGSHCQENQVYLQQEIADQVVVKRIELKEDLKARERIKIFFLSQQTAQDKITFVDLIRRGINTLKRVIK